jgi:hypothetical protein
MGGSGFDLVGVMGMLVEGMSHLSLNLLAGEQVFKYVGQWSDLVRARDAGGGMSHSIFECYW